MEGLVSTKIFRQTSPVSQCQVFILCTSVPAGSPLYIVDLLVLFSVILHGDRTQLDCPCLYRLEVRFCKDGFDRSSTKLACDDSSCVICDLSRFSNVEFDINGSHANAPNSIFERHVAM